MRSYRREARAARDAARLREALLSGTMLAGAILFAAGAAPPALADGGTGGGSLFGGVPQPAGAGGTSSATGAGGNGGSPGSPFTSGGGGGGAGATGGAGGGAGASPSGSGGAGGATAGAPGDNGNSPGIGGAGGGGGGAHGGVISTSGSTNSATISGGKGGDGANGVAPGGGGGGGAGGFGIVVNASTYTNNGAISGGNGGSGGTGVTQNITNTGNGGNGGDGGFGIAFTGSGNLANNGTITGGNGGSGGSQTGGFGIPGNAGAGGVGISGSSLTITNSGTITGGNGANGNSGATAGGAGIAGSNLTIINGGTIKGGLSGDGVTRANPITFTGGTNVLELQAGSLITGNVVAFSAADTLALGGGTNSTFDVSQIGSQYQGFGVFEKRGPSTWVLTNTTATVTPWVINAGALAVSNDSNLGNSAGAISFGGGTLQFLAGFTTTRNVTLNAGGGTFDTNGNDATLDGAIGGVGGLTKTGTGTLTLTNFTNAYQGATIINGGTLALSGFGTVSNSSSVTVGNGAIFDISASSFFFVPIATLAGSGTVQLGGNGLVITNGSTEFSGAINGSGGLEILSGTQTLSGANGYTGPTQIDRGATLALKGAGSIASTLYVGFNPLGSGVATFDISQTTAGASVGGLADGVGIGRVSLGSQTLTITNGSSFAGVIQDGGIGGGTGGSLVISAPGFGQDLSGVNTYTGSTTITANALLTLSGNGSIANSSGLILSGAGATFDISSSSGNRTIRDLSGVAGSTIQLGANSLTVGTANSTSFAGAIDGSGGLVKQGIGALQLAGTNTYTGATTVNAGTLIVNGSIASSAVTVNAGAMLAGTGTVGATTIMNGGTFAPGNSPGTMTVQGNLAFQSGAIYLVQVTSSLASSANVTAGGSATLAGTVNAAFASGSYVTRNYTILSAAGGLGGTTFNALTTSNLPTGFTGNLSYSATDVILNLTATLGQPSGPSALGTSRLSINQKNVANSLNNFFNSGGALPPNFVTIFGLTGGNLGNALTALSGEPATGAQQAAFQLGNQFLGLMLDPFVDGRSGGGGAGGPALGFAPEQEALPEVALAYSKVLKAPAMPAATFDQRWTAWGGAYGGGNKTSGDPAVLGSHDLTATTAGFAGGLDYRLTPNSVVGFALAGGGTNWSLAQGLGGGRSDAFQAGVYGATRWGAAYLAGAFAFTNHWMSTDRLSFSADHLTASFNAQSYGGRVEGGYRFATWYGGVTPYAAIQAQSFHTPGYNEVDGSGLGFALAYNARTGTDTRSELGARFDRVLALYSNAVLALRGRLAWAHDWVSDPTLAALFQTLPGASFVVNGATPVKDSALVSAAAEYRIANGVTLLAKFDGEFASRSTIYAGTGTVRYAW
jgi:autotransporter-associated beta strand protein